MVVLKTRRFVQTKLASPTKCATMQDDKTVILAACTTPVPATQKFGYDKATQQLTTGGGLRARSHCFFAPPLIHFIPDSLTH